jgi:hypothetical protein
MYKNFLQDGKLFRLSAPILFVPVCFSKKSGELPLVASRFQEKTKPQRHKDFRCNTG